MYQALSHPPNKYEGHKVRLDIYRKSSPPRDGKFEFTSKFHGYVRRGDGNFVETNRFSIGYTEWGDKGPPILLLHGVPTNRRAKLPIQELLSPFARTVAIDMLGMGGEGTSMPQFYGKREGKSIYDGKPDDASAWDWVHDCEYIHQFMAAKFPGEKFFFQADDWGGGILSHYVAQYPDELLGAIWVDPIAFDGYPVSEIQAFGRASQIPKSDIKQNPDGSYTIDDSAFMNAMGAADQTMVQIYKTMVRDSHKYNQYVLREIKSAYADTDYERSRSKEGEDANSLTLRLKFDNIRTLVERAAILSPALLLPYDSRLNPKGVDFSKYTGRAQVIWALDESMMPSQARWRFKVVLHNAEVEITTIDNAGHFVETDQPELVAESMYDFMSRVVGVKGMGDIFLGLHPRSYWKGDERIMIQELRRLYGL